MRDVLRAAAQEWELIEDPLTSAGTSLDESSALQLWPAGAFRHYSFAAWLREVDGGSGALACYLDALGERYETPEQALELHGRRSASQGRCELAPAFFHGVGVWETEHRLLFQEWCSERFTVSGTPSRAFGAEGEALSSAGDPHAVRAGVAEGPSSSPRPQCGHFWHLGSDFASWLGMVGIPFGQDLNRYEQTLRTHPEAFTVDRLVQRFLVADGAGDCALDCQIFHEMGMQLQMHRQMLEDWMLGGWTDGDCHCHKAGPDLCRAAGGESFLASSRRDFEQWLLEVDPSGGVCDVYLTTVLQHYDTPEQIVRLYSETHTSGLWSPLFFDDLGIRCEHRCFFDRWLASLHEASLAGSEQGRGLVAEPALQFEVVD